MAEHGGSLFVADSKAGEIDLGTGVLPPMGDVDVILARLTP